MDVLWLLLIACLSCVLHSIRGEISETQSLEFDEDASFIMSSLFGFRPCLGEDCGDLSLPNEDSHVEEGPSYLRLSAAGYEPVHPDATSPSPDTCLPLPPSILRDVAIIEYHHPDIKDVKLKVVKDLVGYVAQLSVLDAGNCDPAMKFLDLIHLAAETLRKEYLGQYAECNYTCGDPDGVTPDYVSTESVSTTSLPEGSYESNATASPVDVTVKPCPEPSEETEETTTEVDGHDFPSPPFVGSMRGIPGVHYPNYTDVPVTSFSCADKKYIPGFYADLETGCQVFHVCYEHRRESFLCPVGTIFNQPILACDYWYSSNCSLATAYYEINAKAEEETKEEEINVAVGELISVLVDSRHEETIEVLHKPSPSKAELDIMKFLPVKAKVTEFTKPVIKVPGAASAVSPESLEVDEVASQIFDKMVSTATNVVSKSRGVLHKIPEPGLHYGMQEKIATGGVAIKSFKPAVAKAKLAAAAAAYIPAAKVAAAKVAVPIAVKTKVAAAAIPAAKVAAAKIAFPIAVKTKVAAAAAVPAAKVAAAKVAAPVAVKTKLAAIPLKAIPKVAAKASVPVFKAKMLASAVPSTKSKLVASVLKGKKLKAASLPLVKAKTMALPLVKSAIAGPVPIVKAKLGTVAAISPLTKKALALGYMKLLKAKKLALLG